MLGDIYSCLTNCFAILVWRSKNICDILHIFFCFAHFYFCLKKADVSHPVSRTVKWTGKSRCYAPLCLWRPHGCPFIFYLFLPFIYYSWLMELPCQCLDFICHIFTKKSTLYTLILLQFIKDPQFYIFLRKVDIYISYVSKKFDNEFISSEVSVWTSE